MNNWTAHKKYNFKKGDMGYEILRHYGVPGHTRHTLDVTYARNIQFSNLFLWKRKVLNVKYFLRVEFNITCSPVRWRIIPLSFVRYLRLATLFLVESSCPTNSTWPKRLSLLSEEFVRVFVKTRLRREKEKSTGNQASKKTTAKPTFHLTNPNKEGKDGRTNERTKEPTNQLISQPINLPSDQATDVN